MTDLAKCICGHDPSTESNSEVSWVECPVCGWSGPMHESPGVAECGWNDVMRDYVAAGVAADDERDELRAKVDVLSSEIAKYEGMVLGMMGQRR